MILYDGVAATHNNIDIVLSLSPFSSLSDTLYTLIPRLLWVLHDVKIVATLVGALTAPRGCHAVGRRICGPCGALR
jgi:hypothetical protein